MVNKLFTGFVVLATIAWAMGLAMFAPVAMAATLTAGTLIKSAENTAVYYYGADGKRYVFPHEKYYKTWYSDFKNITPLTANEIAAIEIGGNVSVKPGTKLVKFTTAPAVYAVEPGSKLKKIGSEAAAKTLYGNDWAKNVMDLYDTLYTNYAKQTGELDGTAYPVGAVVKPAGDYKYYVSESGWRKIASDEAFVANKFSTDFVVNTTKTVPATTGTDITGAVAAYTDVAQLATSETSAPSTGIGSLTLSGADTPTTTYVSKGAQNALFSKFSVKATGGDVTVSQVLVTRSGLGHDAAIDAVRLYANGSQIGTDQSINTNTHKVTFKNLGWVIKSGETQTLMIKANVNADPSGTNVSFNIASSDLTSNATATLGLPLNGNAMQFSALTVGQLNVTANNTAGNATLISGATDQELGCWNFNTTSTEDFNVDSVKFTNIGSAADNEVSDFVLKYGKKQLGAVAKMSNNVVFVDMTASPYVIQKSKTQKVCLYGDIAAGITVSKTLRFQVAEAKHVVARGADSGGEVLTTYSGGTAFVSQSALANTISQGSATLAQSAAYAPVSGTLVKGVESNKMAAYKLTAGSTEGVKLTKLILTLAGTNVAFTDFTNWTLYKIVADAEVEIPVTGSVSGLTITFEDTNDGLLSVAKSQNESFVVRADVSTSAAGNEGDGDNNGVIDGAEVGAKVFVGSNATTNTVARIKGLDSGDYITSGVTLSGVATGNAQVFIVDANGAMVASKAATAPSANTYAPGKTKLHFNTVNLYATGEDMNVTSMDVIAYEADATIGDVADSSDLTNVCLEDEAGNPLGTCVATVSSGVASFSFDLTVPKDSNKLIKVYADIPASASPTGGVLHVDFGGASNGLTAASMTTTGAKSSADITETGVVTVGSLMTITGPTLVASMATTPILSNYVINSSDVILGTLVLTAGTSEDVKVTSIRVSAGVNTDDLGTASSADTALTNFELIDSVTGTQYGVTQNLTSGAPDYAVFSGIANLTVTKGTSKSLYIRADVKASTGTYEVGVADASSHITGTGVSSNTSATVTPNGSTIVSAEATLTPNGSITFSVDASNPVAALVAVGATGKTAETTMSVIKAVAIDENIDITKLIFARSGGAAADFPTNGVKLYHKVGSASEKLIGSASVIGTVITFNMEAGTLVIEKGKTNLLILKALFNGTGNGVSANDAPAINFTINTTNAVAKGAGSGATIGDSDLDGADITGVAQTLRRSAPTITYNTIGTAITNSSEQDIFSFKVKADSTDNVSLKQLKFAMTLTDNGADSDLYVENFKLYRGTTNLTSLVQIKTATDDLEAGNITTEGSAQSFYIYWDTEGSIPAGSEYTYYVKATPQGFTVTADDDRIQVRMESDASAVTSTYKYIVDQDATAAENLAYLDIVTGDGTDVNASIIWSDYSVDAHNYTMTDEADATFTEVPLSSGDWFNGYLVDTTPTNYATLTN